MKTLDSIAIFHGTDKASIHPTINGHDYARFYDQVFTPIRDANVKVLEIGVGGGESIRTWLDYFSNAQVFGVDIVHDTNEWNTPGNKPNPRYTFAAGDQSSTDFWKSFLEEHGGNWDVLIDDGGHQNLEIITSFNSLWPQMNGGGLYCIEDLACGYGAGSVHVKPDLPRHMEFIGHLMDKINHRERDIDSLYFARELAIFRKRTQP